MKKLQTLSRRSHFSYEGSMTEGIRIFPGNGKNPIRITQDNCSRILNKYSDEKNAVVVGTLRDGPPKGSMGRWILDEMVCTTNAASYLAAILVHEGYANLVIGSWPIELRFAEKR
jgi:hypothetical protein